MRDLEERFESRVLPLFAKRTREVLIPELYFMVWPRGDFDLALRGLLGEEAPLSPSTVARLKQKWQGEMEAWQSRRLDDLEVVYLWADGVYLKAVSVIDALSDGTKVVVSAVVVIENRPRVRSAAGSQIAGDEPTPSGSLTGIWGSGERCATCSEADELWNHRSQLGWPNPQESALLMLRQIPYAETRQEAERVKTIPTLV